MIITKMIITSKKHFLVCTLSNYLKRLNYLIPIVGINLLYHLMLRVLFLQSDPSTESFAAKRERVEGLVKNLNPIKKEYHSK